MSEQSVLLGNEMCKCWHGSGLRPKADRGCLITCNRWGCLMVSVTSTCRCPLSSRPQPKTPDRRPQTPPSPVQDPNNDWSKYTENKWIIHWPGIACKFRAAAVFTGCAGLPTHWQFSENIFPTGPPCWRSYRRWCNCRSLVVGFPCR